MRNLCLFKRKYISNAYISSKTSDFIYKNKYVKYMRNLC